MVGWGRRMDPVVVAFPMSGTPVIRDVYPDTTDVLAQCVIVINSDANA